MFFILSSFYACSFIDSQLCSIYMCSTYGECSSSWVLKMSWNGINLTRYHIIRGQYVNSAE